MFCCNFHKLEGNVVFVKIGLETLGRFIVHEVQLWWLEPLGLEVFMKRLEFAFQFTACLCLERSDQDGMLS